MTKPYTYLIGWKNLNKWYYGVRFQRNCDPSDLWVTYFTSSNHVKKFVAENGEPDVKTIRHLFTDAKDARSWEHRVLQRMNARDDERFLNKTNGDGKFFNTGHTEESKRKMSASHLGKKLSEKTKQKLSNLNKGRNAGEKNGMYGQKHSAEIIKKISDAGKRPSPHKGKKMSEIRGEEKAKIHSERQRKLMVENHPWKGSQHTDETKAQMKESAKKRKQMSAEERKEKWGQHAKGKPWTEARRLAQLQRKNKK